jgi:beta-glucanase (GH16 family)
MKYFINILTLLVISIGTIQSQDFPIDFETGPYNISNFSGGELTVMTNPNLGGINTSSNVGQMIKYNGDPWGGSFFTLTNPIEFTLDEQIHMKVYSPRSGAAVLLKIEHPTDQGIFIEQTRYTTTSNEWEQLTFDFSGAASGVYQKVVIIFDNGIIGDGSTNFTFYIDDIELNDIDLDLSDLKVNNTTIPGFDPSVLNYTYTLPAGTTTAPTVTATAKNEITSVTITPANQVPGTTYITVTPPSGSPSNTYSVLFAVEGTVCSSGYTGNSPGYNTYNLIWEDDFLIDGAVCSENWFHQTQLPTGNSWYNGEIQHYTDRTDNSYVENGVLHIVAKKENLTDQGVTKNYTSARLNSKVAFQYGKVEIRAKLPSGTGTWPAIWTLGKNISEPGAYWDTQGFGTTSWPYCGEIDIMEHWGSNQNYVQSAIHTPSSFGGTVNHGGQTISTASTGFHTYTMEWNEERIVFSVDGNIHYTYNPAVKDSDTWPFDAEQYLILNIAILPEIASSFTESAMEIDYVRIYQKTSEQGQTEPITSAPAPPVRESSDVISIYSNAYTNVTGSNYDPNWNQSTVVTYEMIDGDNTLKYSNFNYQGTEFGSSVNVSQMEYLHLDMWTANESSARIYCISPGPQEKAYNLAATAGQWVSYDIPLSHFSDVVDMTEVFQFKMDNGTGETIFLDNLYFYRAQILSSDATLSDLRVDGSTIPGFSPDTNTYSIELAYGTTNIPQINAIANQINASISISHTDSLPGITTIVVTAEDTTKNTYLVEFTVAPNTDAELSMIFISGDSLVGFNSNTLNYTVLLPQGSTIVPDITPVTNDTNAIAIVSSTTSLNEPLNISVIAEDEITNLIYNIVFEIKSTCFADVDNDNYIGTDDLKELIKYYGITCQNACFSDIDSDGQIGIDDLKELLKYYGITCE